MIETYAYAVCVILAGLTIFQLALIAGAPIARFAWGGAHTVLPAKLRVGSTVSIVLYALFAIIVTDRANITSVFSDERIADVGIWVLTVYFFVGVLMNGISRSKHERNLMTPVALVLAVLCLLVAVN